MDTKSNTYKSYLYMLICLLPMIDIYHTQSLFSGLVLLSISTLHFTIYNGPHLEKLYGTSNGDP
jgi:hypothetical protein